MPDVQPMKRLIAASLLLTLPALAQEPAAARIAGRWTVTHMLPGVVEPQTAELLMRTGASGH